MIKPKHETVFLDLDLMVKAPYTEPPPETCRPSMKPPLGGKWFNRPTRNYV